MYHFVFIHTSTSSSVLLDFAVRTSETIPQDTFSLTEHEFVQHWETANVHENIT